MSDPCREAFENWFSDGRGLERDPKGRYKFIVAYHAFNAWQAGWQARDKLETGSKSND